MAPDLSSVPTDADGYSPVTEMVVIPNRRGLHARASARFVNVASVFNAEIIVSSGESGSDGERVCGTSIMGLMMLAAATGHRLIIEATGAQAHEAVDALVNLVANGFNEE